MTRCSIRSKGLCWCLGKFHLQCWCVNLPGVLLNAILRNFSRAVEQGSTLKFIMYSAVSSMFGHKHIFIIYCANCCFTRCISSPPCILLLWCLFLIAAWLYTHHPPGGSGRVQRPSSPLRCLSALWVLPGVWWVMTSCQHYFMHSSLCTFNYTI